ncbi:MAG: BLUF domain-containing protein [Rhizobacter sp.]|nr:BLUF domain-containing protein [Rhizobacter sp.]
MLVRLLYASRAASDVDADALTAILKRSRDHNAQVGVTGVLCFCANARVFMQVLEGGRNQVSRLYNEIAHDPRHSDVALLSYEEIGERTFASWSMGQVHMNRLNPALVLKYSEGTVLDPYAVSGKASLALFHELVETASIGVQH